MRKCQSGIIAIALALAVAACGGSKAQSNGKQAGNDAGSSKSYAVLRWGTYAFGSKLEWRKEPGAAVVGVETLAVQGLVTFEPNGKLKPALASSIENPNPTTYVYHIRSGVKFSNGRPLTVADVVYSLDLNLGKESATRTYWEDVSSVSAGGEHAVVVKLKRPNALWPDYLAATDQIVEKAAVEKAGGEKVLGTPSGLPVGTGPWKIDSFTPEVGVKLSRNPYWNGPPQPASRIEVIDFKTEAAEALALRSGAIDGASYFSTPKLFQDIPGARLLTTPGYSLTFAALNTTAAPFNDVHVRRAVAYAANVEGMLKAAFPPGLATETSTYAARASFVDLGSSSEVDKALEALPKYEFDLAAAKRELAQSAYPHGFTTTLQVSQGDSTELDIAEIMVADLAKIGIKVKLHEFAASEYPGLFSGKFAMWLQNYGSTYPDPDALLTVMLAPSNISPPGSGLNGARYDSTEVGKLLTKQREALNPSDRLSLISTLLKVAGREVPYVPLLTPAENVALSDKYVFPTFTQWTIYFDSFALHVRLAE